MGTMKKNMKKAAALEPVMYPEKTLFRDIWTPQIIDLSLILFNCTLRWNSQRNWRWACPIFQWRFWLFPIERTCLNKWTAQVSIFVYSLLHSFVAASFRPLPLSPPVPDREGHVGPHCVGISPLNYSQINNKMQSKTVNKTLNTSGWDYRY